MLETSLGALQVRLPQQDQFGTIYSLLPSCNDSSASKVIQQAPALYHHRLQSLAYCSITTRQTHPLTLGPLATLEATLYDAPPEKLRLQGNKFGAKHEMSLTA